MLKSHSDWKANKNDAQSSCIIALLGDERALIEEAVQQVRQNILGPAHDFNYDRVSAKSIGVSQILDLANSLPMMAQKRLVEVDDSEAIAVEDSEMLESYFASPNPSTVLLFKFNKVDLRNKNIKLFEKYDAAYNFTHPRSDQMPQIVIERGRHHNLVIDFEVAQMITMEVGTSLLLLERALEKLALASLDGHITPNDVDEQIAQVQLQDAFAMARAVAAGDRALAERFLAQLELSHEVPLRLVGVIAWQLRQVLKARLLLEKGVSENEIAKELSLFGDRLKPVLATARKWPREIHILRLSRLCHLDRELKSSRAKPWHLFDKTIMQLCPSTQPFRKTQKDPPANQLFAGN